MFKINNKIIYLLILFLTIILLLPYAYVLAVDTDSIYVWSSALTSNADAENTETENLTR